METPRTVGQCALPLAVACTNSSSSWASPSAFLTRFASWLTAYVSRNKSPALIVLFSIRAACGLRGWRIVQELATPRRNVTAWRSREDLRDIDWSASLDAARTTTVAPHVDRAGHYRGQRCRDNSARRSFLGFPADLGCSRRKPWWALTCIEQRRVRRASLQPSPGRSVHRGMKSCARAFGLWNSHVNVFAQEPAEESASTRSSTANAHPVRRSAVSY